MQETLAKLEALRNESTYAHNAKFGATKQYGVKLGDIRALAKTIKQDHELGLKLWDTGIADAQLLAILILKPKELTANNLDSMLRSIDFSQVADWFQSYVLKDRTDKFDLYQRWIKDQNKWAQRSAWSFLAGFLTRQEHNIDPGTILEELSATASKAPAEVQWTMNTALAQIGIQYPAYRQQAIALGEKLGLYRDYPVSKGCTSPFAPIWIEEMVKRNAQKA